MQFLVVTKRNLDAFPKETWTDTLLAEESQEVRKLYVEGIVRSIWRRKDEPGAVLLLEAASEEDVRLAVSRLPLAKRGMLSLVIVTELTPYSGFGPHA